MTKYEMVCPYCNSIAPLQSSRKIYAGQCYGLMYICSRYPECDAYVASNKLTGLPVGRMANKELRDLKKRVQQDFDKIWLNNLHMKKKKTTFIRKSIAQKGAYAWLGEQLNIPYDSCSLGHFDKDTCIRAIDFCYRFMRSINNQKKDFRKCGTLRHG